MSTQGQEDVVARLRKRAAIARGEKTGTALGDAYHFDEAADEIERLRTLLSAERARVIEECAGWHDEQALKTYVVAVIEFHRESAAAIRSLERET